ncbi:MAG: glycosyl hydrolase, partial [Deltaproteobacteria bacterium]|nr:glycosyl hydrolase [Deltaproteobacteria bacterium]
MGELPRDTLLVGTAQGIFSCARQNDSWSAKQAFLPGEHISALLFEPSSRTLFAGTYGAAIYASKDLGRSWERRDRGIGSRGIYTLACREIGRRPRLYAGTQPAHLFYSDDLGQSWTELDGLRQVPGVEKWTFPGPPHQAHVKSIAFNPTRSETLYAAVEVGGFLKSEDGGKSWNTV